MKRLILRLVCGLAIFTAIANAQAPKDAAPRTEALRVVDAWLDSVQAYQHIPSVSAGVVVGDDLVWSKGYGTIDASHTVRATPQTIYSICSISKLFTSVALMQLYEQGKVRLDDPADGMELLKPKGIDIFRRVRKDGSEAEEFKFVRDASGKVTSFTHFSNPTPMESPLADTKTAIKQ